MIRVSLVGVRVEVPSNQPIVLLREEDGNRYLPIFIGAPEATAIVYVLQGMTTPRPMTHDLATTMLHELEARITQIVISDVQDGTFFADVTFESPSHRFVLSTRPSDAIALAVRSPEPVPLLVEEHVMEEAGVVFDSEDEEDEIEEFREFLEQVNPEDFV
ncbi:MAG: bifunctional nuclease family protein [Acidimicrobiia bacterium]